MATATKVKGKIIQIVGVVVDVEFAEGELPSIYHALHVDHDGEVVTLEVEQHLSETTVRTVALSSTDGLPTRHRGACHRCADHCAGWRCDHGQDV
jgi:F0F1-type ATP synthase beta subunit